MKHKAALLLALVIGALFAHPAHGSAPCAALEQPPLPDAAASRDAKVPAPVKPAAAPARTALRVADVEQRESQLEQLPQQPVVPESAPRPADWRALLPGSLK